MPLDNNITFRLAEPADALCVGVLSTQVFLDTYATDGLRPDLAREALTNYSPVLFEARIRDVSNHFVLAERGGHLLAFSEVRLSSQPPLPFLQTGAELVHLYVQRRSQRLGIGAALLARAEGYAGSHGAPLLWLAAWVGNADARAFYRAQGYKEAGSASYVFEDQAYENRVYCKAIRNAP